MLGKKIQNKNLKEEDVLKFMEDCIKEYNFFVKEVDILDTIKPDSWYVIEKCSKETEDYDGGYSH